MKIDRVEFLGVLERLKPALGTSGIVPALSHVWFEPKHAYAYDGGFGIRLDTENDLNCGVPGSPLMALLGTSALKEASLEPSGSTLQIKFGKASSKLAVLEAGEKVWPFPLKLPKGAKALKLDADVIEGVRKTLFIKASPATRVEHHGVMLEKHDDDLALLTTDTSTMACVLVEGAGKGAGFERVLLPRDFAEQLVAQSTEGVELYVLDDCLIAEGDGVCFYSNVLDISNADDMGGVMSQHADSHGKGVTLPAGLDAALSRAEILAGKQEPIISLASENDGLQIVGEYALGSLKETLELEGKLAKAKIVLKAGQLRRALTYAETISITKDSLLLTGEPGFTYLMGAIVSS